MTEPDGWRQGLHPKIADEAEHIIQAFRDGPDGGTSVTVVPADDGGIDHMHAEGEILVRAEHLGPVLEVLGQPGQDLGQDQSGQVRRLIAGHVRLALADPHPVVAAALERIDERLGRGVATPNHVLTVAGGRISACPATEPEEVYAGSDPHPSVCPDAGLGSGVLVYTADTGLLRDADSHPWLAGVRAEDPECDLDPPEPLAGSPAAIAPYVGHGTFVAGVLRSVAPAAEVVVTNAFSIAGSVLESDLVARLESALRLGADIFHLSIACASRHDLPLLAFGEWLARMRQYKGTVCVAAAGNSGMRRPSWPAAFEDVIAVGALGGDGRGRASFSNFGGWVDVYAPGRDLVNAYATGSYTCHVSPYKGQVRSFHGMAKWSGTSFAAPIVTGRIAARMSRTGENARQAAAALLAEARAAAIPGVGAVLLPG
jgi:subtilisin family serine protease